MDLPEDDAGTFGSFVTWIYSARVPEFEYVGSAGPFENPSAVVGMYTAQVIPLISLANKLCVQDYTNQLIDRIQQLHQSTAIAFDPQHVKMIYDTTSDKSKFRDFCAASFACLLTEDLTSLAPEQRSRIINGE
jgi:tRNA(Met) C34 N-acetyltransferase TmcA